MEVVEAVHYIPRPPVGHHEEPHLTWQQKMGAWIGQQLFGEMASCPVGFYYDKHTEACVPLCSPGYKYDRHLKKCVRA